MSSIKLKNNIIIRNYLRSLVGTGFLTDESNDDIYF